MNHLRKLLLVTVSAIALSGVQACSSGSELNPELNPQPLPPSDPARSPEDKAGNAGVAPPNSTSDAGAYRGDASDGGGDH